MVKLKVMKPYVFLFAIALLVLSCKNETKNKDVQGTIITEPKFEKLAAMEWLLGSWVNEDADAISKETWTKQNDSTFTSFSYTQVANDTVFAETVTLQQKDGELLFKVLTFNQNDDQTVTFTMLPSENGQHIFENKNHDFPSQIVYTNPVKDSLHVWILGAANGETRKIDFYFKREN